MEKKQNKKHEGSNMVKKVCDMEVLNSFEDDEPSKDIITLYEDDDNTPEWLIQVYEDDINNKEKSKKSNNSLNFGQKRKISINSQNDNKKKVNVQSLKEPMYKLLSNEKKNNKNFEQIEIITYDSNEKSSLNNTANLDTAENNEITIPNANTIQNVITDNHMPHNSSFKNINQKIDPNDLMEATSKMENTGKLPRTKRTPHRVVKKFPGKMNAMKNHSKITKNTEDPAQCQHKSMPEDLNMNVNNQLHNLRVSPPHTHIQDPVNEKLIEMLTKNLLVIYPARYKFVNATTSIPYDPQKVQFTAQELERRVNRCFEASYSIFIVLLEQKIPIISMVLDCYRKKLANDKDILLDLNYFEDVLNKMIISTQNRQLKLNQYADNLIRSLNSERRQQNSTLTNILSKPPLVNSSSELTTANNLQANATGLTSSLLYSGGTTDREIRITYEPSVIEKQTLVQHVPMQQYLNYAPQSLNSPQLASNVIIHQSVTKIPAQHITPNLEQQTSNIHQMISKYQQRPPGFRQQIPNFQQQMPNDQQQISNFHHQTQRFQNQIPSFQHQIPNFQQKMQSFHQQIPSAVVSSSKTLNKPTHQPPPSYYHHQRHHQTMPIQNLNIAGQFYQNNTQANVNSDKSINYNYNAVVPATSVQQRSSVSRDSGIVSPRSDERPTGQKDHQNSDAEDSSIDKCVPVISYVTSMNPDVLYSPEGKCNICNRTTNLRCLGCNRMYYCSVTCQKADWENHKLNCKTEKEGNKNDPSTIQCIS